MAEKGKEAVTSIHLSRLIHCYKYETETPEYVLERGKRVHELVQKKLKQQCPHGMAEAKQSYFTEYGMIFFTPDFVCNNGDAVEIIEIKGSKSPPTLTMGLIQLSCYMALIHDLTGMPVVGKLMSVNPDTGEENVELRYKPKELQKIVQWLVKRLKERQRKPPIPLACEYCIYKNKCNNNIYDKPPKLDYMLRSLSRTKSILSFL